MKNNTIDNVAKEISKMVLSLASQFKKPFNEKHKAYIVMFIKFFPEEISEMCMPFRKVFKDCGYVAQVRKYCFDYGDVMRIGYQIRFFREGYNIVCYSDNLQDLKRKFIEKANRIAF